MTGKHFTVSLDSICEPTEERREKGEREKVKAEEKKDKTVRFFSIATEQNKLQNCFIFGFYPVFV